MSPRVEKCRTCGASIYWLRNNTTNRMAPIDAAPADNGNIEILDDLGYRVHSQPTLEDGPRHLNHFVTCKQPPRRMHAYTPP